MELSAGDKLGAYEILAPLGAGGMGEVYRARDARLGREVAVKVLPGRLASDPGARRRFEREAKAAAVLSHPNILALYDVGVHEGVSYVVMELLEGETLRARLDRAAIGWSEAVEIGAAVADGLAAAHAKGVVHRDIKPENLFLTNAGVVKILDFGLARLVEPVGAAEHDETITLATRPGAVMGTAHYMSPEQVRGQLADTRSDIFSFGCVCHEMVGGRRPFARDTAAESMAAILKEEPPSLSEAGRSVPVVFEQVIKRCLEKRPERRFQSSSDLAFALRAIRSATATPAPTDPPPDRPHRRAPALWIGAAAVVVLAMVAAFYPRSDRDAVAPPREGPRVESIAVLPFRSIGDTPDGELFAEGMTDILINDLGRIAALRTVISHRSVMRYQNSQTPPADIARELKVDALVQGSVFYTPDQIRLTVWLSDANDELLWPPQKYTRKVGDVMMLQSELAQAIAGQVQAAISPEEAARLARTRPVDPEVFRAYMLGRRAWNLRTEAGSTKAIEHFNAALAKDPAYAPAHAGLADCYMTFAWYGYRPSLESLTTAKMHASSALGLDDTLADAYASRALARLMLDWEWTEAERDFREAIRLKPSYATAHHWYAITLRALGRYEEALARARRAQALAPLSPVVRVPCGAISRDAGRHDEAIAELRAVIASDPDFALAPAQLSMTYAANGMFDESIVMAERAVRISERAPLYVLGLAQSYAWANQKKKARASLAEVLAEPRTERTLVFDVAGVYALLGETDTAMDWLERAADQRNGRLPWVAVARVFTSLHSHPRFQALIRRMGLEPTPP